MTKTTYFQEGRDYVELHVDSDGNKIMIAHSEKNKYSKNSFRAIKYIIENECPIFVRITDEYKYLSDFMKKYCEVELIDNHVYKIYGRIK